jgi:putative oxidoreductase
MTAPRTQEAEMIPERYAPQTYAVMRIVFGLVFLMYGLQKFGMLGGQMAPLFSYPYGLAGIIELIAGLLIVIGLGTRVAAFVACGEMAVAYFTSHMPNALLPVQNNGQPAVLFCFAFLYMAARGSGIWSVDAARK